MTDSEFMAWLRGYCYRSQGEGYGDGAPPDDFTPIIPLFREPDGSIGRARTLDGFDSISAAQKARLLQ
jgi:hypothetical protein